MPLSPALFPALFLPSRISASNLAKTALNLTAAIISEQIMANKALFPAGQRFSAVNLTKATLNHTAAIISAQIMANNALFTTSQQKTAVNLTKTTQNHTAAIISAQIMRLFVFSRNHRTTFCEFSTN